MVELQHVITDALGFHARPVMLISAEAARWESGVTVSHGEHSAPASDPIALMGLEANQGDTLVVRIEGPDEQDAAEFFEHMLRRM